MDAQKPTLIFVKQPEQIIDDALKVQRTQKKKVEEPFDLTVLENLQMIKVAKNFRKYMPKDVYESQVPDFYKIDSQYVKEKFEKLLDGVAEITVEVRSDEGALLNEESKDRILKIALFNEDSMYFSGYHYACLFMEVNEEAWFIFDDGYTAPQSFTQVLLSYDTSIERQSLNKIYKIKLHKLKLQQRRREIKEGQEVTQESIQKIKEEEIEKLKESLVEFEEKRNQITDNLFRKNLFKEAYEKFKKFQLNVNNNYNRFAKSIEYSHPDMVTLKALVQKIGLNKIVSAFKAELYQHALDEVLEQLQVDPTHQKIMYFHAKCLFKLAYFDKAEQALRKYIDLFPNDTQSKIDFEGYLKICLKKQGIQSEKEKKLYPKVLENLQSEEQKEKLRKLNEQSISQNLKKDKEIIINKILNEKGYEFNTESDLLKELEDDDDQRIEPEFKNKQPNVEGDDY